MNEVKHKIESFTDLHTWQEGHELVVATYRFTKKLPNEETFALKSQMQRAAVSVTSNIAEGFSRSTFADKLHFYHMAKGSLTELQNQFMIAKDVGYMKTSDFDTLLEQSKVAYSLLTGLIVSTKKHNTKRSSS